MAKTKKDGSERSRYFFEIYNHADLRGPWEGWRLRGAWLVSPDGDRLNVTRLRGLLCIEKLTKRKAKAVAVGKRSSVGPNAWPPDNIAALAIARRA